MHTAEGVIASVHPDPGITPVFSMKEYDEKTDLSVIIPVYNYAEQIAQCIESILNQKTQFKYEVILVDDGSTDGSGDVLRIYSENPHVKTIYQDNQGIAGARNTGLNNAVGKYIMFIDCDDTVTEDLIETLMSRAYHDNCDITMCGHDLVKEKAGQAYETLTNIYPEYNLLGYAENAKILNYPGLPWCKVYKRELWENVRFYPGYWYEDNIIHSLLFTQCRRFAYEPISCYQYRWYENNFSHVQNEKQNPKCIDMYWMMKRILKKYEELGLPFDERFETMLIKHLSAYYYNKVCGMQDEVLDALFILACDLFRKYGGKTACKLPYMLGVTKKALEQGNIELWKLSTRYQK